ncbi:hypothetical protein M885DRAFT_612884 [Pelagophyceae sp. CCMP2097]|nr:hypothetical protein M885DRAFT_612884 [Pelagophyceae sp. CCMP2097]
MDEWLQSGLRPLEPPSADWSAYQQRIFDACAPFWRPDILYVRDRHGFQRQAPGLDYEPLKAAAKLFEEDMDFETWDHVVILGQASLKQIAITEARIKNGGVLSKALKRVNVPLPLMYHGALEVPLWSGARRRRLFFSGACTSELRGRLAGELKRADAARTAGAAYTTTAYECGHKRSRADFVEKVSSSLWVAAPRGRHPATFMLSEAWQAGSLPVYIYDTTRQGRGPRAPQMNASLLPSRAKISRQLPYANIGLNWSAAGLVLKACELSDLPDMLRAIKPQDAARRLGAALSVLCT